MDILLLTYQWKLKSMSYYVENWGNKHLPLFLVGKQKWVWGSGEGITWICRFGNLCLQENGQSQGERTHGLRRAEAQDTATQGGSAAPWWDQHQGSRVRRSSSWKRAVGLCGALGKVWYHPCDQLLQLGLMGISEGCWAKTRDAPGKARAVRKPLHSCFIGNASFSNHHPPPAPTFRSCWVPLGWGRGSGVGDLVQVMPRSHDRLGADMGSSPHARPAHAEPVPRAAPVRGERA